MLFENYLGNKTAWKILRVLTESPGRGVTREEIRKLAKAGNFALSNSLDELERFKIIERKKSGKKFYFWIAAGNEFADLLTRLFEAEKKKMKGIFPSKRIFIGKIVETVLKYTKPKKIILFGSQVKGTFSEESDYDICLIFDQVRTGYKIILAGKLPENVQTHYFSEKDFEELRKKGDKLVEEIIRDGVELLA